jgi:hypothetical protein
MEYGSNDDPRKDLDIALLSDCKDSSCKQRWLKKQRHQIAVHTALYL